MIPSRNARVSAVLMVILASLVSSAEALNVLVADDHFAGNLSFLTSVIPEHVFTIAGNTDATNNPILTSDVTSLEAFDVVIFYGSGNDNAGRAITAGEQAALEAYIQGGGSLIATGLNMLY